MTYKTNSDLHVVKSYEHALNLANELDLSLTTTTHSFAISNDDDRIFYSDYITSVISFLAGYNSSKTNSKNEGQ